MLRSLHRLPIVMAALTLAACTPPPAEETTAAPAAAPSSPQPAAPKAAADEPVLSDPPAASLPTPAPTEEMAMCDASKAQFAVRQSYSVTLAEQARVAAGAKIVRRLVPGQMVTMEFSPQRLNLDTDAAGKVTAARCG